jgi:hypothetical protein
MLEIKMNRTHLLRFSVCLLALAARMTVADADGLIERAHWGPQRILSLAVDTLTLETPTALSDRAQAIRLNLGDDLDCEFAAIVDASDGAEMFDTIYFDGDQDGKFSETERSALVESSPNKLTTQSLPATINYFDGSTVSARVQFSIQKHRTDFRYRWRVGRDGPTQVIMPDGKQQSAIIVDSRQTPNGCFNDFGSDMLLLDANGNGEYADDTPITLTRLLRLDDTFWSVNVDATGDRITLTPSQTKIGSGVIRHRLAEADAQLTGKLVLRNTLTHFTLAAQATNQVHLPVGTYSLDTLSLGCKDRDGKSWSMSLRPKSKLAIKADEEAVMNLGAPLQLKLSASQKSRRGQKYTVRMSLHSADGSKYRYFRQNRRIVSPMVTVTAPDGTTLASGKMEYG